MDMLIKLYETGPTAAPVARSMAVRKPIRIGGTSVGAIEIAEGVKAGDRVVIAGSEDFGDVDRVKIND